MGGSVCLSDDGLVLIGGGPSANARESGGQGVNKAGWIEVFSLTDTITGKAWSSNHTFEGKSDAGFACIGDNNSIAINSDATVIGFAGWRYDEYFNCRNI